MKKSLGVILIALGAAMLVWTGFTYTKKEKVVDAGPIEISANKKKSVNWPPYAGAVLLVGGVLLIAMSRRE
jgi:drug/metabolite transporter (DMT)-like permease